MRKPILAILTVALAVPAIAANNTIFTCANITGEAYYPNRGLVSKKDAGWQKDGITNGSFSLTKVGDKSFDILYVDSTRQVSSSVNQGASVVLLGSGKDYMTFLVNYPDQTVETYFFYQTAAGQNELLLSQTKYNAPVTKAAVFRGTCFR